MKKLLAALMALMVLCGCAGAHAARYGWAFLIYDLGMSIEMDGAYQRTDEQALAEMNGFEKSGNVKPDLILELYHPETYAQLFVYCAEGSPYDNLDELTGAYAEDLGASGEAAGSDGTSWQILPEGEFYGLECARILSSFQNVNAEYVLLLSEDHSAYIITLITFDGTPPDSQLDGIEFGLHRGDAGDPALVGGVVHLVGDGGGHVPEAGDPGVRGGRRLPAGQAHQQRGGLGAGGGGGQIICTVDEPQSGEGVGGSEILPLQGGGGGQGAHRQQEGAEDRSESSFHGNGLHT